MQNDGSPASLARLLAAYAKFVRLLVFLFHAMYAYEWMLTLYYLLSAQMQLDARIGFLLSALMQHSLSTRLMSASDSMCY